MSIILPGEILDVSKVTEGIYVGAACGNPWLPAEITDVVSLCKPSEGAFQWNRTIRSYITFFMDDIDNASNELSKESLSALGDLINSRVAFKNGKVLIHCYAGQNRSCLVAAIALIRSGIKPEQAVELLEQRRGHFVLSNHHFRDMILDWYATWK